MKRRAFLKNTTVAAGTTVMAVPALSSMVSDNGEKSIFEFRIYHISNASNAKKQLGQYFKDVLIPFLQKHGVGFEAFHEYSLEEPVKLYALLSFPNVSAYFTVQRELLKDDAYRKASQSYRSTPVAETPFTRYETFLLEAFDKLPAAQLQGEKKGLFELRIYESANEDAGQRKIDMFNNEEIALFLKVGLNPVFFGKILAGQYMPALMYMLGFKDMADRDASWGKFVAHEDWNTMRVKPEYADTVSNIRRIFLTPADYAQG